MTAATDLPVEQVVAKQSAPAQAREKLSSPWASLFAVVIAVLWTVPTAGCSAR